MKPFFSFALFGVSNVEPCKNRNVGCVWRLYLVIRKGIGDEDRQNFMQRNLKICILQQFDQMNQHATGFICNACDWYGKIQQIFNRKTCREEIVERPRRWCERTVRMVLAWRQCRCGLACCRSGYCWVAASCVQSKWNLVCFSGQEISCQPKLQLVSQE